jgi:hypothetical protein
MFLKYKLRGNVYYAAIDPSGGGGAAPGAQPGGAPTPTPQPGSQGPGQGGGFREQFFPNVPDEHWALIEPHISGVNQHVTQLQQRYAPFKGYRDEDLQGLAQFSTAFDQDPLGQWIRMAKGMQAAGVMSEDLDIEHLASLLSEQGPGPAPQQPPNAQQPPQGDMPPWAQALVQRIDQLEGGVNQDRTTQRQQVEDAVLKRQIATIKGEMQKGGIAEGMFSEESILAAYIAHRGNAQAAAKSFVDARNAILKGYTKPNDDLPNPTPGNNDLELPNGAPTPRTPAKGRGRRGGMIDPKTVAAASQFLQKQGVQ